MQPQQRPEPIWNAATELERERMTGIVTRRALYASQRQAIELMEQQNEQAANAIVATIQARIDEAAKVAAAALTGDAQVVELRPGGPVAVDQG